MYKERCIGRLINFLNEYCGCRYAYDVTFHGGYNYIDFYGSPFAVYKWDGNTNIPTFKFLGEYSHHDKIQERLKGQTVQFLKKGETVHKD